MSLCTNYVGYDPHVDGGPVISCTIRVRRLMIGSCLAKGSTIELPWRFQEDAGSAYGAVYDMQLGHGDATWQPHIRPSHSSSTRGDLGMAGSTGLECRGGIAEILLQCQSMMFTYHRHGGFILSLCSTPSVRHDIEGDTWEEMSCLILFLAPNHRLFITNLVSSMTHHLGMNHPTNSITSSKSSIAGLRHLNCPSMSRIAPFPHNPS